MYDAIVVGARCAGSPTAMLLARSGYRVLLVDRAAFPSDTLSTHYIHQYGVERLYRWGLVDDLAATTPAIRRLTFDVGPFAIAGTPPPAGDAAEAYAPRRRVLDQILIDAAVDAGAEFRERFSVDELLFEDGRVTGIRGRAAGGPTVTERARIVIGADGMHSHVARAVEAPTYEARPALTCAYYSYWGGLDVVDAELYPRPQSLVIAGPTNDRQTLVIVYWPRTEFHAVRADVEGAFLASLDAVPALGERVRAGERSERFYGTGDLPFFFRRPHGPGWALVGDAGYHKDPNTALGISDAFRDVELLCAAVAAGLDGDRPLDDALADYERMRNDAAMPLYELTYGLAMLAPPPPEMQAMFAALREDQEQANRFFGTLAGTVPLHEFFGVPAPT